MVAQSCAKVPCWQVASVSFFALRACVFVGRKSACVAQPSQSQFGQRATDSGKRQPQIVEYHFRPERKATQAINGSGIRQARDCSGLRDFERRRNYRTEVTEWLRVNNSNGRCDTVALPRVRCWKRWTTPTTKRWKEPAPCLLPIKSNFPPSRFLSGSIARKSHKRFDL